MHQYIAPAGSGAHRVTRLTKEGYPMVHARLKNSLGYCLSTMVEEGPEMIGVILFINAALHYVRGVGKGPVRAPLELAEP
jgi:hypothetical protein